MSFHIRYILSGITIGFVLSLIAVSIEDYIHTIPLLVALSNLHHYFGPIFIGIVSGIVANFYYLRKKDSDDNYNELIFNQSKYQTILSNISNVIAIIDSNGTITYKSPGIERFFGWNPNELLGKEAWVTVHPNDISIVQNAFFKVLSKENEMVTINYRYKCKDGSFKPIRLSAINLISDNKINGILCNYKDLTEQVKQEQALIESEYKYRTLFENMTDAVCILNNEKQIVDVNNAVVDLYEYSKEEFMNMPLDVLVYPEDKELSDKYFQKLETEGFYKMYEGRVVTKTGKIKWIQVNSTEFIREGVKDGSQDIIRDITKRKEIEIELKQTIQQLHNLNATKDKLFSIIAHDLRSPFSSILGVSQLMKRNLHKYNVSKIENYLNGLISTAENTLNLLDNLLNWAKTQTGDIRLNIQKVNLKDEVNETLGALNSMASLKKITIHNLELNDLYIKADKSMLNTVLRNLISNAIKFTSIGGKINIYNINIGNKIEIVISDNGMGMNPENQQKLFNIKTNNTSFGTLNEKGSGLGLVLCKEIIDKHQEEIWVESELNKGSKFIFTMPLWNEED